MFGDSPYKIFHPIETNQWICKENQWAGFCVALQKFLQKNNIREKKIVAILMKNNNSYEKCFIKGNQYLQHTVLVFNKGKFWVSLP